MLLPRFEYHAAANLEEACRLMSELKGEARLLAGGTDLLVDMKKRKIRPSHVVSLNMIDVLKGFRFSNEEVELRACTTAAELASAEVSVDLETGKITLENLTDAHDCGFAINRTQVEGQIQGCLSMGLGEALFEEVKFDAQGRILNPNFAEYKIPTALDMPHIDPVIIESFEPYGPFGAKEVGEGGIMPTIPAILNAVHDAVGVRIDELPMTPERVYTAMERLSRTEKDPGPGQA